MANAARGAGGTRHGHLGASWKETVLTCGSSYSVLEHHIAAITNSHRDGGGIRGYVSLFLLHDLMLRVSVQEQLENARLRQSHNISGYDQAKDPLANSPPLPCHYFDYVVGTSTGG